MSARVRPQVLVAGAGLGGTLMAIYLARAGHRVRVFERRGDPRAGGADAGRSINLAISTRGLHALGGVGLDRFVLDQAVPMRGRMIHPLAGRPFFSRYGSRDEHVIHSVSRLGLNIALIDAATAQPNVEIAFGQRITDVEPDEGRLVIEDEASGESREEAGDFVVGADGAFSAVRARMQRLDRFDFEQSYLEHGYKELTIPPGPSGRFRIEANALHIWPRGGFMMIALPNVDGSFTCTLFWPFRGETGFESLSDPGAVRRHFESQFLDAVPLIPDLVEEYRSNPVGSLVTVRCRPWHHGGRLVLVGDACHAVVPFYGQGANAAFEDCVVLDDAIRRHPGAPERAFEEYEGRRKVDLDTLADLAIENFVEMRDHVTSQAFRWRKRSERLLHRLLPRWFVPLYTMVTFTRTPYAAAREKAQKQWRMVGWVGAGLMFLALLALVYALSLFY